MNILILLGMLILPCAGVEFDFGSIPEPEIRATVVHLQQLAKDSQEKYELSQKEIQRLGGHIQALTESLLASQRATSEAKEETAKVQREIDVLKEYAARQEREKLHAQDVASRRGKWVLWLSVALGGCLVWIFRKPLLAFFT